MTSSNQVSVSQVSDVTTVEITTQGPQGASSTSGISNVVEDTSPQLGGNLDVAGQDIVSTSNGNVELDPMVLVLLFLKVIQQKEQDNLN